MLYGSKGWRPRQELKALTPKPICSHFVDREESDTPIDTPGNNGLPPSLDRGPGDQPGGTNKTSSSFAGFVFGPAETLRVFTSTR